MGELILNFNFMVYVFKEIDVYECVYVCGIYVCFE